MKTKNNRLIKYPIRYQGNKYNETKKHLTNLIDYSQYDIICEPFGGIFGFSRCLFELNKLNDNCKIIINDIRSDLINAHNILKNCNPIELHIKLKKYYDDKNLKNFSDQEIINYINNNNDFFTDIFKIYNTRMFKNNKNIQTVIKNFDYLKNYSDIFKHIEFLNMEFNEFIEYIKSTYNDKKILIYCDPPYFMSDNKNYNLDCKRIINKGLLKRVDNTKFYIDILNLLKSNYHTIVVIGCNHLINELYKDFFKKTYSITYSNTLSNGLHANTSHTIYTNINAWEPKRE